MYRSTPRTTPPQVHIPWRATSGAYILRTLRTAIHRAPFTEQIVYFQASSHQGLVPEDPLPVFSTSILSGARRASVLGFRWLILIMTHRQGSYPLHSVAPSADPQSILILPTRTVIAEVRYLLQADACQARSYKHRSSTYNHWYNHLHVHGKY